MEVQGVLEVGVQGNQEVEVVIREEGEGATTEARPAEVVVDQ